MINFRYTMDMHNVPRYGITHVIEVTHGDGDVVVSQIGAYSYRARRHASAIKMEMVFTRAFGEPDEDGSRWHRGITYDSSVNVMQYYACGEEVATELYNILAEMKLTGVS